jgi:hypothetical protein
MEEHEYRSVVKDQIPAGRYLLPVMKPVLRIPVQGFYHLESLQSSGETSNGRPFIGPVDLLAERKNALRCLVQEGSGGDEGVVYILGVTGRWGVACQIDELVQYLRGGGMGFVMANAPAAPDNLTVSPCLEESPLYPGRMHASQAMVGYRALGTNGHAVAASVAELRVTDDGCAVFHPQHTAYAVLNAQSALSTSFCMDLNHQGLPR